MLGERQFAIDSGDCNSFTRAMVDAVPYPANDAKAKWAPYGGLARDGISCAACHHMVLGEKDSDAFKNGPQNKCVAERQAFLNPGLTKSAQTFTGSFFVGPADRLYGPFAEPKIKSMKNAIGVEPAHHPNVKSSELCGSCHTVHLPVMHKGAVIGHTYEQSTYPEWAFSAYRTGTSPDGPLPGGAGPLAQSCQDCHMPSKDPAGNPYRSKIASIQEYSNFPEAEHTLPPADIDLKPRDGFAKHTLVGLNLFLLKMAAQFPELLGLRVADPMLTKKGIDPVPAAEDAMIEQALNRTASVTIGDVKNDGRSLSARVTVDNKVGHKFPSGVGFRRAFIEFEVLDAKGKPLWASGRTNGAGVIVDDKATPIAGELWWKNDCSARIAPEQRLHQPHYQVITRQDQAQIYQELVAAPPRARRAALRHRRAACGRAHHELPFDLQQGEGQPAAAARLPRPGATQGDLARARRQGGHGGGYRAGRRRRRPRLPRRRSRRLDLPRAACRARRQGKAGIGQSHALLPGDAAVLPAGPLLHLAERRHQAALLHDRQAQARPGTGARLEIPAGHQRAGRGAVNRKKSAFTFARAGCRGALARRG